MIARLPAGLATALVAALLMAPSLLLGTLPSHSSPHNLIWASQFAEQFRAGIVYPRWMPDSFEGLGGPAFYFYPPLAFWIDGLLNVATFGAMPTPYRLSIVSWLLLWGSGWAMHRWLRAEPIDHRWVMLGAFGYQAAPYHLADHYVRGAIAEFAAYAVLPLVALGIRRIAESREGTGVLLLAITYAGLLLAHLPTALLISIVAIPAYVLFCAWTVAEMPGVFGLRCAAAGTLGGGLAAIYLMPAMTLQESISSEQLWTPLFGVEKWFLTAQSWIAPDYLMSLVLLASLACAMAAIAALLVRPTRREAVFWAAICLVAVALLSGLVPWFWSALPLVSKVQFPFRLLIVAEFAALTAPCRLRWHAPARATRLCLGMAAVASLSALGVLGTGVERWAELAWRGDIQPPRDAKEYLPAGYPQRVTAAYDDLSLDPVRAMPLVVCMPQPRRCDATPAGLGALTIDIDAAVPTTVVLRRFFFPGWQLEPALTIAPTADLRLVSFQVPAGPATLTLSRVALPIEGWGWTVSAISLAVLLLWSAAGRWKVR